MDYDYTGPREVQEIRYIFPLVLISLNYSKLNESRWSTEKSFDGGTENFVCGSNEGSHLGIRGGENR